MGKIIGFVLLLAFVIFVGPTVVLIGWNCARELWPTLPQASYWQVFWIANAIQLLFKTTSRNTSND